MSILIFRLIAVFIFCCSTTVNAMSEPSANTNQHSFEENNAKKIIVLEGLDGTGKTALAKRLLLLLGDKATVMHIDVSDAEMSNGAVSKESFFSRANAELSQKITMDPHPIIILDRSWLSGEATRYATEHGVLRDWPQQFYRPTHLFVLTLPEQKRLWFMEQRASEKPFTDEEIRLRDDGKYREDYLFALKKGAKKLRTRAIYRELDGAALSINQMADKIVSLLDKDLDLLDARKITISGEVRLREFYQAWQQRSSVAVIESPEYIKITADVNKAPVFDAMFRTRHQCHFDNVGKIFDYARFAEPRHLPAPIGTLENKADFDKRMPENLVQARDMPIAFPTDDPANYEYRVPVAYGNLREFIEKVANTWHSLEPMAHKYYAYLTVTQGTVPPWQAQRRPGIHCDGFQSARISPKEPGEFAFVASNALPTAFYVESFNTSHLDPSQDNFFAAYSSSTTSDPVTPLKSYQIGMMDPYCLHAAVPNTTDAPITRTFARIIYSTRKYDRIGNTHNPAFDYQWEMVRREALLDLLPGKKK